MSTVLAVNAGSSNLKLAVFEVADGDLVECERVQVEPDEAVDALDARMNDTLLATGHRVVFGGLAHSAPALVTPERLAQ